MNMVKLGFFISIAAVVALNVELCFSACARAEYEVNGECCPMCAPGNHVYWDCTIDTSTTCVPCPASTYSDEPNSSSKCFSCSVCEPGQGLRVKKTCTHSADTVCEPLDGLYCIERNKKSCRFTARHSECSPGQCIKQAGTGSTDTVCADCTCDTYSDGSFSSCLPHTKCEALGLTETNPGTHSSDIECGNPSTAVAIIAPSVIVTLILILVIIVFIFKHIWKKKQSKSSGIQETGNGLRENDSSKVVGGRKIVEPFETEEPVLTTCERLQFLHYSDIRVIKPETKSQTALNDFAIFY